MAIPLTVARKYFPIEAGISDQELLALVATIAEGIEPIINQHVGLQNEEPERYTKKKI